MGDDVTNRGATGSDRRGVTLVTFGSLTSSSAEGEAGATAMARYLYEAGRLERVLCLDVHGDDLGIPRELIRIAPSRRFYALVNRLLDLAGRVTTVPQRLVMERVFDLMVSRSLELRSAQSILFAKPALGRSAERARRLGIPSFVAMPILHPAFNSDQVKREAARFGLPLRTPYTDASRVRNIERLLAAVDFVLSPSPAATRSFVSYGVDAGKIIDIGSGGIDSDRFPAKERYSRDERFVALHLSAMNLIKGVSYLLEAWKKLDLPNAVLRLAGRMDDDVKHILHQIDAPNVEVVGFVDDIAATYREADIFVSPSLSDGGPATVLEAMSSGTPVIMSDQCGSSALVRDGEDGFVYHFDDIDALATLIRRCAADRVQLEKVGRAARRTAFALERSDYSARILAAMDRATSRTR